MADTLTQKYTHLPEPGPPRISLCGAGDLIREFALPGVGSVTGFSGERKDDEFFFSFTSFVEPGEGGRQQGCC